MKEERGDPKQKLYKKSAPISWKEQTVFLILESVSYGEGVSPGWLGEEKEGLPPSSVLSTRLKGAGCNSWGGIGME